MVSKKLIRELITEYKTGVYKGLTLRQVYQLVVIKSHVSIFNGAK